MVDNIVYTISIVEYKLRILEIIIIHPHKTKLDTAIFLHLRCFSTIVYQKDSCSFQQWVQREAKQSYIQDYKETDTHKHTYTHTHTHTQIAKTFHLCSG